MTKLQLSFRPANADLDDGRLYARYLDRAAEGFFRFWLGKNAEEIVARAFLQSDHDLSYRNVTFAERDGIIIGMVSGYTAEQHRRSSNLPLKQAAGRNPRMTMISILFRPMMRIIDTIDDGDYYVQAIAVEREHEGGGVGSTLMDSIEERARATGSARLVLDVSAQNRDAFRLYEHRGMVVDSRWPKRIALPGLTFYRMAKAL